MCRNQPPVDQLVTPKAKYTVGWEFHFLPFINPAKRLDYAWYKHKQNSISVKQGRWNCTDFLHARLDFSNNHPIITAKISKICAEIH